MILDNLPLAYSIAFKYQKFVANYYDLEDAKQICAEGLIIAVDKFDATKGFKFSTFAYPVIRRTSLFCSTQKKQKQLDRYKSRPTF